MGARSISLALSSIAVGAVLLGCGNTRTTIYPLNGAKQSYVAACQAQIARERGLSPALRSALEANCSHPNTAGVQKAASQQCSQAIGAGTPGLSAAVKRQLANSCSPGNSPTSINKSASQICQQTIKNTVPPAQQQQALAACPKP